MREETRKILDLPQLRVAATCVRVPVQVGHSLVVTAELERPLAPEVALEAMRAWPGIIAHDRTSDPLPRAVAGTDPVHVGRLRTDPDDARVLHFWVVADNLRKGAATNAVQIAEQLLAQTVESRA